MRWRKAIGYDESKNETIFAIHTGFTMLNVAPPAPSREKELATPLSNVPSTLDNTLFSATVITHSICPINAKSM